MRVGIREDRATVGPNPPPVLERLFPEVSAGGFTRMDGTVEFYVRVNALLRSDMTVLDFGAGRGAGLVDSTSDYRRRLRNQKGKVAKVIGVDVDPVVTTNPGLDEAHTIEPGASLPLPDASVDVIVADFVFEHIPDPTACAAELDRVLRPGGWICARTPNRWGYVALAASLIPERLHAAVLRRVQPMRKSEDVFPTVYRMNDRRTLARLFPKERYRDATYTYSAEPAYIPQIAVLWRLAMLFEAVCPDFLKNNLFVFVQKRGA